MGMRTVICLCLWSLLCLSLLTSCDKEEGEIPLTERYYTDWMTIHHDAQGELIFVHDDGRRFSLQGQIDDPMMTVLAYYVRTVACYAVETEQPDAQGCYPIRLDWFQPIRVMVPTEPFNSLAALSRDPFQVERIWTSGRYLNAVVGFDYYFLPHYVRLFVQSYDTLATPRKLSLELFHNRSSDPAGSFAQGYFSFDLSRFRTQTGDTLLVHIVACQKDTLYSNYERHIVW